jgi:hypothetical protein
VTISKPLLDRCRNIVLEAMKPALKYGHRSRWRYRPNVANPRRLLADDALEAFADLDRVSGRGGTGARVEPLREMAIGLLQDYAAVIGPRIAAEFRRRCADRGFIPVADCPLPELWRGTVAAIVLSRRIEREPLAARSCERSARSNEGGEYE